jgi:hypothetical protein
VVERLTHALFEQVKTLPDFVNCALTVLEGGLSEVEGDFSSINGSSISNLKNSFSGLPADMRAPDCPGLSTSQRKPETP